MLVYAYLQQSHKETLRILTTPVTYVATANVAKFLGQKVSFADIDIESYCLSPFSVRDVTEPFDVISLVHLYGNAAEVELISKLHPNATIVEDGAQAFGTRVNGKHIGTTSFGCFFYVPDEESILCRRWRIYSLSSRGL